MISSRKCSRKYNKKIATIRDGKHKKITRLIQEAQYMTKRNSRKRKERKKKEGKKLSKKFMQIFLRCEGLNF